MFSLLYKIESDNWEDWESIPVGCGDAAQTDNTESVGVLQFPPFLEKTNGKLTH